MAKKLATPTIDELQARLVKEYDEAKALLDERISNKKLGFDAMDRLYQVSLNTAKWPYSVALATPRGFTSLFNKGTRMIGGRLTGRIDATEASDEAGAMIATEHFKWSVNRYNQHSDRPVEAEIFMWDQNTRTYGAGFAMPYWKTEYKLIPDKNGKKQPKVTYDNWFLDVLNNRDVLLQPGRETIQQSDYVIVRRYMSLEELERITLDHQEWSKDALAELRRMKEGEGRKANYDSVVTFVKGLTDNDNRFEVCTTYYRDRWITWCPKKGSRSKKFKGALVLRDISNPYRHQEIPIVPLVYIPSEEDIYGMSELQPVASLLKILSALQSQFIELVNLDLYQPIMADATENRLDTWKYRPKAIWLTNNPDKVKFLERSSNMLNKFSETYKMIITEFLEAMGETGASVSQVDQMDGNKTATEIRDKANLRGARDSFNKLMLNAALRKVMYFIFEMLRDPKFVSKDTVIKITGKEALKYFDQQGFSQWGINDAGYELVMQYAENLLDNQDIVDSGQSTESLFDLAYTMLMEEGMLDQFAEPLTPIQTAKELVSKLEYGQDGENGYLHLDVENDYRGDFDFIPDVEALSLPDPERDYAARASWYQQVREAEQAGSLQREGYTVKHKDILSKLGELARIKEANQYFDKAEGPNAIDPTGAGNQGVGSGGQELSPEQALQGDPAALQQQAGPALPTASGGGMAGPVPMG